MRWIPVAAMLALIVACADNSSGDVDDPQTSATGTPATVTTPSGQTTVTEDTSAPIVDELAALPEREGPRRETTHSVPHVQVDAEPVPEVLAELRRRAFSIPGIQDRPSEISLPGARALWLADDVELVRSDVFLVEREFAHIHADGSLHVWMPVERALEVAGKKWGELHPWVGREDFWDGLVMIYTPESFEELDVTLRLIVDAYNFVTGSDLDPGSY